MGEQKRKSNWWKWAAGAAAFGAAVFLGVKAFGGSNNTQTAGVSVTPTVLIAEASPTPEQMVTVTPEPSPTLIPTETPTATPTEAATLTPELTITDTPTPEPTEEPSPTPTEEVKPTETVTPTQIPTNIPTVMPTASPKPTATPTVKPTVTPTPSPEPTTTPTSTPTPVPTNTPTPKLVAWEEPKERKDIAELLMAKVNDYRISQGVRKWENPYVYYDVNAPGLGDRLNAKGLRVAKKCCMEHSASHEGYQIGTGIYGYPWRVKEGWEAEDIAQQLFDAWYNSSAHNWGMLYDGGGEDEWVSVAVMHVTEHFDGEYWHYCAIMTLTFVYKEYLPEGLE